MFSAILLGTLGVSGVFYLLLNYFWPGWYLDYVYRRSSAFVANIIMKKAAKGQLLIDEFEDMVPRVAKKTFIIFEDRKYSYEYIDKKANQVARAVVEIGVTPGATVAVLIYNEPAIVWTYLGLMKAGCPVAFINFNLRSRPLSHCINVSEAKVILVGEGEELVNAVKDVVADIPDVSVYLQGSSSQPEPPSFLSFELVLSRMSEESPGKALRRNINIAGPGAYIYTSGTTGLPKPVVMPLGNLLAAGHAFDLFGMTSDDVIYQTLPLYHSIGLVGLANTFTHGATMVLKRKFSAGQFFEDCRKYDVTIFQYIGELCRYLIATPKSKMDGVHKIKHAIGNGLRMDIWETFQHRFKIPKIIELYGATESMIAFFNVTGKVGACGRSSPYLRKFLPCEFVKFDLESQSPQRNKQGWCIPIEPNEVGLLIVPVIPNRTSFSGYKGNAYETEKKLLHDVCKKGDTYFNTGDLMRVDSQYYLYFSDRVGDTFRWKGENVSTTEVSNILADLDFIQDASVYGVAIPGTEGRAGMAAITLAEEGASFTPAMLNALSDHVIKVLPSYARPRFIRVTPRIELTSTFKQQKVALVKEGFDVSKIAEPLFYLDPSRNAYLPLDQNMYSLIMGEKLGV